MRCIASLTLVLAAFSSPVPRQAIDRNAANTTARSIPPELQTCLDFARRLDTIERRSIPAGARRSDPIATLIAFVEHESGQPVRIEEGCTLAPTQVEGALQLVDTGPCALRSVLAESILFTEPRMAWTTDGDRIHLVLRTDLDAWLARTPEPTDLRQVRERLRVRWDAPRIAPVDADTRFEHLVLDGRLQWRDDAEQFHDLHAAFPVVVQVARAPTPRLGPCEWDTSFRQNLPYLGDGGLSHYRQEDLTGFASVTPDGHLCVSQVASAFRRRAGARIELPIATWVPCADRVLVGKLQTRIVSNPTTIFVDGPSPLTAEQVDLNAVRSSAWLGNDSDFDPIALVRASNRLRALGKKRAIAVLREQLTWFRDDRRSEPVDGEDISNPDTLDGIAIELLVTLVFDVAPTHGAPRPWFDDGSENGALSQFLRERALHASAGFYAPQEPTDPVDLRKTYPLWIVHDVPFLAAHWLAGRTGCDLSPRFYLDLAESYGELRAEPLVPPDDPTLAADELLACGPVPEGNDPRGQIVRALERTIGTVFTPPIIQRSALHRQTLARQGISDSDWQRVKDDVARRGVHWDAAQQAYVATR